MGPKRGARGPRFGAAASRGLDPADHGAVLDEAGVLRRRDRSTPCSAVPPAALSVVPHGTADRYVAPIEEGVRITHEIAVAFRFPWTILVPVLALLNKRALAADLDSLRRAIDEGHDLTARNGP
jgi:hypothetical protein